MDLVVGYGYQGGPVLAQFAAKDAEKVMAYLDTPEVRKLLPRNLRYIKFSWENQPQIVMLLIYMH